MQTPLHQEDKNFWISSSNRWFGREELTVQWLIWLKVAQCSGIITSLIFCLCIMLQCTNLWRRSASIPAVRQWPSVTITNYYEPAKFSLCCALIGLLCLCTLFHLSSTAKAIQSIRVCKGHFVMFIQSKFIAADPTETNSQMRQCLLAQQK